MPDSNISSILMSEDVNFKHIVPSLERHHFLAEPVSGLSELKDGASTKMKNLVELYVTYMQAQIVRKLELYEEKKFQIDPWRRVKSGGGITCVLQEGKVFEKIGVNISSISGDVSENLRSSLKKRGKGVSDELSYRYFATGLSIVAHPRNPHIPSMHANLRYFELTPVRSMGKKVTSSHVNGPIMNGTCHMNGSSSIEMNGHATTPRSSIRHASLPQVTNGFHDTNNERSNMQNEADTSMSESEIWWFGGSIDQTPYYLHEEDHRLFHQALKDCCDKFNPAYYPTFKTAADDYLYLPHRGEYRGVGGISFDDMNDLPIEDCFDFIVSCGGVILPSYTPIIDRHINDTYTHEERTWQLLRRGRYIEFNLLCDRGIRFGLEHPSARVESVLMALPLEARWTYCEEPVEGSEEWKLMQILKTPKDWTAL